MIPARIHAVIDYAVGALLLVLPYLLGFADGGAAQSVTIALGATAIVYSLLTRYELGIFPLISFKAHLGIDVVYALLLAASPWLFGFAGTIWWPHVAVAAAGLLVVTLSRREAVPQL